MPKQPCLKALCDTQTREHSLRALRDTKRPASYKTHISEFVAGYIKTNQAKLLQCYRALEDALSVIGVGLTRCQGTLMAWADFRRHLRTATWDAELELWRDLFSTSRILLTTGKSCSSNEPGFFRICYAWPAVTDDDPTVAMKELKARLLTHFKH